LNRTTQFKDQLFNVNQYAEIPVSIIRLEEQSLLLEEQTQIVDDVMALVSGKPKEKLVKSLRKNPFRKFISGKRRN